MSPRRKSTLAIRLSLGTTVLGAIPVWAQPAILPSSAPEALVAPSAYYRHSIFDNSLTSDRYYFSSGSDASSSGISLTRGRLPVDTTTFHSAPNALRLQWWSAPRGYWEASVRPPLWRNRGDAFDGTALIFWAYSPRGLTATQLPRLRLRDGRGRLSSALALSGHLRALPSAQWVRIVVPLEAFQAAEPEFEARRLETLYFMQGAADSGGHVLLIDDIKIDSAVPGDAAAPAGPTGLRADAAERHVDLTWTRSAEPDIEHYVVQRSDDDGRTFRDVGVQQAGFIRYSDWVGEPGRHLHYRIAAVDRRGNVSSTSQRVAAVTRPSSDDELMTMVQAAHFRYYWEGAHPIAGLARENIPGDDDLVATGASGFGILAILVGAERGFITRQAATERLLRIATFLEKADRFHGAWPHFLNGRTGKVIPLFGAHDNGADLVETAFLMQGLLTARQYFAGASEAERILRRKITALWEGIEWRWFRRTPDGPFLFWHWSPDHTWQIDHPLIGFNETMIAYILAIASPTHPVPPSMYYTGWASQSERGIRYRQGWGQTTDGDHYANGHSYYGIALPVGVGVGGPLFFTHYSFMGLDPRQLTDRWTNYFANNRALALINHAYAIANPGGYRGYGPGAWGLTASDDPWGYSAHEPRVDRDNGTIAPTGALGSFPYAPEAAMAALRHFYRDLGGQIWGEFGFRDAFNETEGWIAPIYMGLNQAPVTVMIENHRSGSPWRWFMANPEMMRALEGIKRATEAQR
ncbi:MAG TPA: glucoamylase family protein [Gemmatimonadaceae bacterium]|nr:glucoamylase family protein [Gemmatimonadaceae bacterium]